MTSRFRLLLFFLGALGLGCVYVAGVRNLAPWGDYRGPYGDVISALGVYQRHTTDVVNAIDYDYRGFDTLGEEFILFSAVTGVAMLFRPDKSPRRLKDRAPVSDRAAMSETVTVFALGMFAITVLFGIYIALHGQLTPGGGFQGGVVIASAPMLIYIARNYSTFRKISSSAVLEFIEALGAAGYALIGLAALGLGLPFLTNFLPLGSTGDVFSSGTIALISATVGVEVTGGFIVVTYEYLRQIIAEMEGEQS